MQLICLNTWGAQAGVEKLLAFFQRYEDVDVDVDVFCLQEVWNGGSHMIGKIAAGRVMDSAEPELFSKIARALPRHVPYFRPHFFDFFGLAVFVKKDLSVLAEGECFIYRERGYISAQDIADHARNLQYVTLQTSHGPRTIIHLHGAWHAGGKVDTPARLMQSEKILDFTRNLGHPFILCGDFNLLPTTKSIQALEAAGLRNLIAEHGITSTRTSLYSKPVRFADYVFLSHGLGLTTFRLLPDEVSDHCAMFVEFA
jgi:endonuclease/exonuclease/phosphatase family metal-dependent hydrolase